MVSAGDKKYILNITEQMEGEEQYLSRSHFYSIGWFLAFDLTTITSIESLEEYYKKYYSIIESRLYESRWISDDPENRPIISDLVLVGTKADLAANNRVSKLTTIDRN